MTDRQKESLRRINKRDEPQQYCFIIVGTLVLKQFLFVMGVDMEVDRRGSLTVVLSGLFCINLRVISLLSDGKAKTKKQNKCRVAVVFC